MKMKAWRRILSLVLAVLVVAPMILGALPQLTLEADAAVDAGGQGAGREGQLINGVYEIYFPGTDLAFALRGEGSDRPLHLDTATHTYLQRWVIEYGGSMTVNGTVSHWYTIRNLQTGYLLGQTSNYFVKTISGDTSNDYCKWRIEYDAATGTYSFQCWGQYYAGGTGNAWPGYMTPVVKLQSTVTAYEHTAAVTSPDPGTLVAGKADRVGFKLSRVAIQYYDDYELTYGTYRVMDPSNTYYWDADPYALSDPGLDSNGSSALACTSTKQTDGTQLFQIDWTSSGFVTIFDCYSGRYLGDRNGNTTMLDGAISELWDDPGNWFDDRLRFYWVVVPVYSGVTWQEGRFYLCNVLTGNSLTMTTSTVQNYRTGATAWSFTKLSDYDIAAEDFGQGYNGNTGVYMDSFDHSDTIKLPIKIYDYVNDGMLFEYAQSNAGSSDNNDTLYDAAGKKYQTGNNLAFSLLTGSYGGEWYGMGGYYYEKLDTGASGKGNDPKAWNTYETFSVGRMWKKYKTSNGWYQSGTSSSNNNYYWEKHGLGNFRSDLADRATTSDAASVYMMYGLYRENPQGLNKDTVHIDGTTAATIFTEDLKSGDTSVNPSGSSYTLSWSGYSYDLYGYLAGTATIGMVQPELNPVTGAPEYRDVVVEYLADLLQKALAVPKTNPSDSAEYAYNYVDGANHDRYGTKDGQAYRGLDDWLRSRMTGTANSGQDPVGSYAATKAKADKLIGTWAECSDYIRTYCDAAYYLLNNLFVPYSYNEPQDMFDYLELTNVKMDDSDGNIVDAYVFDSGFTTKGTGVNSQSAVYYDTQERVIKNTQVTGKANAFLNINTTNKSTNYACAHPFLPVWETLDMSTQTGTQATTQSPYFNDDGVSEPSADATATYQNRNYNFVLASNGEFQYSHDDELFFNFEGDDDVYLFINGQLVMDLGAAHGIAGFSLDLNDYVDAARAAVTNNSADARDRALALEEGGIYSFDFYYMERHGWGSNMRIATNIRVVEKGMLVDKGGAQLGVELESNDMIDPDEAVEYKFTLVNSGTEDLIWPTFVDNDIQVKISYDQGLQILSGAVNGQTVMDADGGELDVTDLIVSYYNPKTGNTTTRTFASDQALIHYLTDELVIETQAKSTPPFGVLTIRGIYYKLTDAQKEAGVFRNTVTVTAQVRNASTSLKPLNGLVSGSSKSNSSTITDGDGTVTVTGDGSTDRVWPYINLIDQVTINPDAGLTVMGGSHATDADGGTLEVEDLTFIYTGPDGSVTVSTFTDNAQLIEYLRNGLVIEPGGTLVVEGIRFDPSQEVSLSVSTIQRDDGSSRDGSNDSTGITLQDQADFTVYVPNIPKYYHWMDHELVIYHSILSEDIKTMAADADNPLSQIFLPVVQSIDSVVLADADGDPVTSDEVWIEGMDIHASFQTTGIKLIHLNVGYSYLANGLTRSATATIPVRIYVYDVEDRTYVLDYGLQTQLSYDEIFGGDVLELLDHETLAAIMGIASEPGTPSYGGNSVKDFTMLVDGSGAPAWGIVEDGSNAYYHGSIDIWNEGTGSDIFMSYTPKELMESRDHVYIALRVWEDGYTGGGVLGSTDIRNEVMMYKDVTFLPANVVYYEDNFPAINVTGEFEDPTLIQSWDQTVQYGYDKVYASDADVTTSGGHIAAVPIVPPTAEQITSGDVKVQAAQFTFSGTGFELISRTDATSAAAIQFDIYRLVEKDGQWVREDLDGDGDTEDDIFKRIPVITEYDNCTTSGPGAASTLDQGTGGTETIYQVPVFRLSGLDFGRYEVVISGIPVVSDIQEGENGEMVPVYTETTYLYIDGIRIYDPLVDATQAEYGQEYGAEFTELRTLVFDNQAAVLGLTSDPTGAPGLTGTYGAHNSFAESRNDGWFQSNTGDLQQFAIAGPNNEVYIDGTSNTYAVLFYVAEDVAGQGTLHVGVHDLYDDMFYGMDSGENLSSSLRYYLADGMWSSQIPIGKSGTEQYSVIDYRSCPTVVQDGKTYYQVAIQVAEGMVSFTNVKTVGLSFADLTPETNFVRYKFQDNFLYEAPRYDMDGNEIPEAMLDWQPVSLVQRYHYRINSETGDLERADRYDAAGNEIPEDQLVWKIINSAITSSVYHMRDVLTTTRTADDEVQAEGGQVQMPQLEQGRWPDFPGDDGRSLWARIMAWLKAVAQTESKERSAGA